MKIIVNVNKNWAIGKEGELLIHIPEDMRYFREQTKGGVVIMGRKTLLSFPDGKPLKGRLNLVLTRDPSSIPEKSKEACDKYYDLSQNVLDKNPSLWRSIFHEILKVAEDNFKLNSPNNFKVTHTFLVSFDSLELILKLCFAIEKRGHKVFVIGGESIYKMFLGFVDECLVTVNDCSLRGDSFFPDLSKIPAWRLTKKGEQKEYEGIHFAFDTWERAKG